MDDSGGPKLAELGFFQEPYWFGPQGDFVKSLLLFFDGIALLTPDYMSNRPFVADPALAEPLADQGLLQILSPEKLVSEEIAQSLADLFEGLMAGGAFDDLEANDFAEISNSRLGFHVSPELMMPLLAKLEVRGLAKPSEDGVSRPVQRTIRSLVLATLGQLLREPGEALGFALQPVGTGTYASTTPGLLRLLDRDPMPTAGSVVVSDLQQVGFDLSAIPLDEVLGFREQNGEAFRRYARDLREFVRSVSTADPASRDEAVADLREGVWIGGTVPQDGVALTVKRMSSVDDTKSNVKGVDVPVAAVDRFLITAPFQEGSGPAEEGVSTVADCLKNG